MRAPTWMVAVAVLLAGCSDDSKDAAPPTTPTHPTTTSATAPPSSEGTCADLPNGSSPAEFDAATGTFSVQELVLDIDGPTVTFDVVQWLSGDDARTAWLRDHPEEPDGPPNDYYILDESDRLRDAPVRPDAEVHLTHLRTDGTASVEPDTLEGLDAYLLGGFDSDTYWLTFDGGVVTAVCEQYRP